MKVTLSNNQTFFVAILGISALFIVLLWMIYWVYRAKLLEREERRLMIERGMTPPSPLPTGWPAVKVREKELEFEERRLRIEKGLEIPTPPAAAVQPHDYLRKGLKALGLGAGIAIGYRVFLASGADVSDVEMRNWMMFFAVSSPVLGLYGAANVVYYIVTKARTESAFTGHDPGR